MKNESICTWLTADKGTTLKNRNVPEANIMEGFVKVN